MLCSAADAVHHGQPQSLCAESNLLSQTQHTTLAEDASDLLIMPGHKSHRAAWAQKVVGHSLSSTA